MNFYSGTKAHHLPTEETRRGFCHKISKINPVKPRKRQNIPSQYVCVSCLCSKCFPLMCEVKRTDPNYSEECLCPVSLNYDFLCRCGRFFFSDGWCNQRRLRASAAPRRQREERLDLWCFVRASSRHALIVNTRHSHPWSDVVGGEGVSGWECTGGLRTGGKEGEESVDGVRWE